MSTTVSSVRKRSVAAAKKKSPTIKKSARKWSGTVTRNSNALDLKARVFLYKDPDKIAASLKRSAERSKRKKGTPLQSAMSMLNFYINRAGKNLTAVQKRPLEKAKSVLRALFKKKKMK